MFNNDNLEVHSDGLVYSHKINFQETPNFRIGILGDPHTDALGHDRKKFEAVFKKAVKDQTPLVSIGDLFDVMQGRQDRRGSKGAISDDIKKDAYFNAVVEKVADYLEPYLKKIPFFIAMSGNHETAITRHNEIDLIMMLKHSLYTRGITNFYHAGYRAYFVLEVYKSKRDKNRLREKIVGFLHHGHSGGQRSKGTLGIDLRQATYHNVDWMATGHNHMQFSVPTCAFSLNKGYVEEKRTIKHIQVPSFKEDVKGKKGGWAIERGYMPQPTGGYWVDIELTTAKDGGFDYRVFDREM